MGILKAGETISGQKFPTDWRTSQNRFVFRKILQSLREIAADLGSRWDTDLVGKARCHIRFMDDGRNMVTFRSQNHRNGHKSAFGKYHIRLIVFDQFAGFRIAFQYAERIGKVLQIEVSAEFS